jgi:predicted phosphodiesterase
MKIALLGDTHWGVRNDSLDFLDYFERFFYSVFFPELKKRGITRVVQLGDIVDRRKFISYITLNRMRKFFAESKEHDVEWDILIGNHDTPYKNTNDINSMRELFSRVDGAEDFIRFYSDPTEIQIDGTDILMLPWINSSNHDTSMEMIAKTKAQIAFGHLEIKDFEMYRGMPSHEGMDPSILDKFEVVVSGHFHHMSKRGNILYAGTPYEMTWSDWDDPRGFHVFDTESREIQFVRNPLRMFHKVFYDDSKPLDIETLNFKNLRGAYVKLVVMTKNDPYKFDLYTGKLYEAMPVDVVIVEDHRHMDQLSEEDLANEAEDTFTILNKYIDTMEVGVDKNELANLLRSLYNEALNMEANSNE